MQVASILMTKSNISKKIIVYIIIILTFIYSVGFAYFASASPSNEEGVKEKLAQILSELDSEKKNEKDDDGSNFIREKIMEFIEWLFEKLDNSQIFDTQDQITMPTETSKVMKIVAIVLILLTLGLIFYFILRNFKRSRRVMMDEDAEILSTVHDPDIILDRVRQCSEAGDYSQALRFLYIAMLISFNKLNIIRINKSKTNKQYLIEIESNRPQIYNTVVDFTDDFNKYWYGKKELGKTKFESLYQAYSTVFETEGGSTDV